MPIAALPEATVRLLGSPLVLTTPVSVVKELVENAVDAGATSIDVLISKNTVDSIEVRDNGHGIGASDYDSLGRQGHTSKLRNFEELREMGGSMLGFRGEALASAKALGKVTITTRTATDPMATTLHLVPGEGGIAKQGHTSASVGTAVRVTDLFSSLPVRKRVAVVEGPKTIPRVRELLRGHALARPHLRLSFKVLGDTRARPWHYAPRPGSDIREVVLQVFGAELASHCVLVAFPGHQASSRHQENHRQDRVRIEAFLPRADADPSVISSRGAFFSVDSRLLSTERGTMKKLLSTFKARLSKSLGLAEGSRPVRDPFIRVDIRCPPGSYDPNVEPSKNDIIFVDEPEILRLFEGMCASLYKGSENGQSSTSPRSLPEEPEGLLGLKELPPRAVDGTFPGSIGTPTPCSNMDPSSHATVTSSPEPPPSSFGVAERHCRRQANTEAALESRIDDYARGALRQVWRAPHQRLLVDMSANVDTSSDDQDDSVDACLSQNGEACLDALEDPEDARGEGLNPWTIAKMNEPHRPADHDAPETMQSGGTTVARPLVAQEDLDEEDLYDEPPILRQPGGPPGDLDLPKSHRQLQLRREVNTKAIVPGGPYRSSVMRPMVHQTPQRNSRLPMSQVQTPPPSWQAERRRGTGVADRLRRDTGPEATPDGPSQTRLSFGPRGAGRGGERTKRHVGGRGSPAHGELNELADMSSPISPPPVHLVGSRRRTRAPPGKPNKLVAMEVPNAAEFSEAARAQPEHGPSTIALRYRGTSSDNVSGSDAFPSSEASMPSDDPRVFLIGLQDLSSHSAGERDEASVLDHTELLPLEDSAENTSTVHLAYIVHTAVDEIARWIERLALVDGSFLSGEQQTGLDMTMGSGEVSELEFRLKKLLRAHLQGTPRDDANIDVSLSSLLKGKSRMA